MVVRPCILYSEDKQYPFRFMIKLDSFGGGAQPFESKKFSFINATQCVPFEVSKLTLSLPFENGPSLRYIWILSTPIEEGTW